MKRISFKDSAFGWDGLTTFIFSNLLIILTLGLFWGWLIFRTFIVAVKTNTFPYRDDVPVSDFKTILIAGLCLENNLPTEAFKVRLNRAITLQSYYLNSNKPLPELIILGGVTGKNQVSEAQAGANYLIEQGIKPERIILEQDSRHTLENMQHARAMLTKKSSVAGNSNSNFDALPDNIAVITSRFHLLRLVTLAKGLNMSLQPVAAEDRFHISMFELTRVIREAYYLHWYWSGKLWVWITANQASKARIS